MMNVAKPAVAVETPLWKKTPDPAINRDSPEFKLAQKSISRARHRFTMELGKQGRTQQEIIGIVAAIDWAAEIEWQYEDLVEAEKQKKEAADKEVGKNRTVHVVEDRPSVDMPAVAAPVKEG